MIARVRLDAGPPQSPRVRAEAARRTDVTVCGVGRVFGHYALGLDETSLNEPFSGVPSATEELSNATHEIGKERPWTRPVVQVSGRQCPLSQHCTIRTKIRPSQAAFE